MRTGLVAVVLTCAAAVAAADSRSVLAATPASQVIQNRRADVDDLSRMRDNAMVLRFRRAGLLVRVAPSTPSFYLHDVASRFRYLRPWARLFLRRLSRQFHARFGRRLRVTALVRTARYQRVLNTRNANAADASGALRSSHLTGATLDISKRFMSAAHVRWVRRVLYQLHRRRVLYAVEEFSQPCFHVMVYRDYLEYVREITS